MPSNALLMPFLISLHITEIISSLIRLFQHMMEEETSRDVFRAALDTKSWTPPLDSFAGSHFPVLTLLRAAEPGCKTPSSGFCSIPRLSTDPLEMGMVAASSSFAEQLPHFLQHSQGSSEQSSQSRKYCIAPKAPRQGERETERNPPA